MLARTIATLCAIAPLAGCVSYQDPRTPEQQKLALQRAANELAGSYTITDSRNDDGRRYTQAIVSKQDGSYQLSLQLVGPATGAITLAGSDCRGWYVENQRYTAMQCDALTGEVNFFSLVRQANPDPVNSGTMPPSFTTMVVPQGSYLFDIADRSGRHHYYVLTKTPLQQMPETPGAMRRWPAPRSTQ
ncbi:hypothetical protein ACTHR6_07015 [Ralstonia holmesii]|uniref:hypothetical protein n=1 Tax=Ralstonia TaxID=48736 RepID=UPI00046931AA|nr:MULTISPECIES: hypothetical protein [Ralstonia]CAJ0687359.1 hypothetical protein R11007_00864 [Ralstonia sp. LMG 32967]